MFWGLQIFVFISLATTSTLFSDVYEYGVRQDIFTGQPQPREDNTADRLVEEWDAQIMIDRDIGTVSGTIHLRYVYEQAGRPYRLTEDLELEGIFDPDDYHIIEGRYHAKSQVEKMGQYRFGWEKCCQALTTDSEGKWEGYPESDDSILITYEWKPNHTGKLGRLWLKDIISPATPVEVLHVIGATEVARPGVDEIGVREGENLHLEDQIYTGLESSIMLQIDGNSSLNVGELSDLSLHQYTTENQKIETIWKLDIGEITAELGGESHLKLEMPIATIDASSAIFNLKYDGPMLERATLEVLEGEVVVHSAAGIRRLDHQGKVMITRTAIEEVKPQIISEEEPEVLKEEQEETDKLSDEIREIEKDSNEDEDSSFEPDSLWWMEEEDELINRNELSEARDYIRGF